MKLWRSLQDLVRTQREKDLDWIEENPTGFKLIVLLQALALTLAAVGLLLFMGERGSTGRELWAGVSTSFVWVGCSVGLLVHSTKVTRR
jgi:hypothetical protein